MGNNPSRAGARGAADRTGGFRTTKSGRTKSAQSGRTARSASLPVLGISSSNHSVAVLNASTPLGIAVVRHLVALGTSEVRAYHNPRLHPAAPTAALEALREIGPGVAVVELSSTLLDPAAPSSEAARRALVESLKSVSSALLIPPFLANVSKSDNPTSNTTKHVILLARILREARIPHLVTFSSSTVRSDPAGTSLLSMTASHIENTISQLALPSYTIIRAPPFTFEDLFFSPTLLSALSTSRVLLGAAALPPTAPIFPLSLDDLARATALVLRDRKRMRPASAARFHRRGGDAASRGSTVEFCGRPTTMERVAVAVGGGVRYRQCAPGSAEVRAHWKGLGVPELHGRAVVQASLVESEDGLKGGDDFGRVLGEGPEGIDLWLEKNAEVFRYGKRVDGDMNR